MRCVASLGGAGFSLSIRAKLGLSFLCVSASNRPLPSPKLSAPTSPLCTKLAIVKYSIALASLACAAACAAVLPPYELECEAPRRTTERLPDPSRYVARCRRPLGLPPDLLARHLLDRLRRSPTRELPPLLVARPRVERRGRALAVERCRRVDAGPRLRKRLEGRLDRPSRSLAAFRPPAHLPQGVRSRQTAASCHRPRRWRRLPRTPHQRAKGRRPRPRPRLEQLPRHRLLRELRCHRAAHQWSQRHRSPPRQRLL